VHDIERLPIPPLHTLEQFGNLRFMDLRCSGRVREFRSVAKQRRDSFANKALDLTRRQSPTWLSTVRSIRSRLDGGRVTRDVVPIASAGLDGVAWREQRTRFVEEFSAERIGMGPGRAQRSSRCLRRELLLDGVPCLGIDDRQVLPLVDVSLSERCVLYRVGC
jgi:hypothetical protein